MRSPYTPGVGLEPNFLAGRESVIDDYNQRLIKPAPHGKNMVISGLRGIGKSVLLKRLAVESAKAGWIPVLRELSKRSNREDELIRGLLAEMALRLKRRHNLASTKDHWNWRQD
jgi:ABC-type transporter Mla maintaining outer membrane lipid asymmetry ATPase subunit MlaF